MHLSNSSNSNFNPFLTRENSDMFQRSNTGDLGLGLGFGPGMVPAGQPQLSRADPSFGMPSSFVGATVRSTEMIIMALAKAIDQQHQVRRFTQLEDFFLVHDLHQGRAYESWEFPIIFNDAVTREEGEALIRANNSLGGASSSIPYQSLAAVLSKNMPLLRSNPLAVPRESTYVTKPKHPQIQTNLQRIVATFKQRGAGLGDIYQQFFPRNYIEKSDFQRFLQTACGIPALMPAELDMLFAFFQLAGETMLQKTTFIQALKALDQQPQFAPVGMTPTPQFGQSLGGGGQSFQSAHFAATNGGAIQGSTGPFQQQTPVSPQVWDTIKTAMVQSGLTSMRSLHTGLKISQYNGKVVVSYEDFIMFLCNVLRLDQTLAFQVTQPYLFTVSQQIPSLIQLPMQKLIDLEAFESQLYKQQPTFMTPQLIQQQQTSYQSLQLICDAIRQYIIFSGGDIMQFFTQIDVNKDNFLSKAELKQALEKISNRLTDDQVTAVFFLFDENKDGRISYSELCKYFAEFSNTKAVKDPRHWAWYIFENIRRICTNTQRSLTTLFGLNVQFQGWDKKIKIQRDQFFRALSQLQIPITPDHEKQLLDLLESTEVQGNWEIDFMHFSDLVGVHFLANELQQMTVQAQKTPLQEQSRRFFRTLFTLMEGQHMTVDNLQAMLRTTELRGLAGRSNMATGCMPVTDFIARMQTVGSNLDANALRDLSARYPIQGQPAMLNYDEFIRTVTFEFEKYKLIDMIFITMQAASQKIGTLTLRDLFTRALPTYQAQPQVDKASLERVLQACGGVNLKSYEIDMVIMEFESSSVKGLLDFGAFEKEYHEFTIGKSQYNPYSASSTSQLSQQFSQFISQPSLQNQSKRTQSPQVREVLKKMATALEFNQSLRLADILPRYQVNQTLGSIKNNQFELLASQQFGSRFEEIQHLITHYDSVGRGEIRVAEWLEDLKEYLNSDQVQKRLELIQVAQQYSQGAVGVSNQSVLLQYQRDFEEIHKALKVRDSDAFKWFTGYSHQPTKNTLSVRELAAALQSLSLSRNFSEGDLSNLAMAFGSTTGLIEISAVNMAITESLKGASDPQLQEAIIERVIRAFNGDDGFLLTELGKVATRGYVDSKTFLGVLRNNCPSNVELPPNDILYLALKYGKSQVDINIFHSDIRRVMVQRGIQQNIYNPHQAQMQSRFLNEQLSYTSGRINPLLGGASAARNTRFEQTNRISDLDRSEFKVTPALSEYLEQMVMGTYVRGQLVAEYFQGFASDQATGTLEPAGFASAIQQLGVGWTITSTENVFQQIDMKVNGGQRRMRVTATQIDQACCLGTRKGIDELQEETLKTIVQAVLEKNHDFRALITAQDISRQKLISVDALCDVVLSKLKVPILSKIDVIFLARKYIGPLANMVQYEQLVEDFTYIQNSSFKNIANYKQLCTYIRRAGLAYFRENEVENIFSKYSRVQQGMLTVSEFLEGCRPLQLVPACCEETHLKQLFEEIDASTRMGKISLAQLSNYVKKTSSMSTMEMQDDVIGEMANKKAPGVETLFRQDDQKDRGLVDSRTFTLKLQRTFGLKEIDAILVSLRYEERGMGHSISASAVGEINYKKFLLDLQKKSVQPVSNLQAASTNMFGTGLYNQDSNSEIAQKLVRILKKLAEEISKVPSISLVNTLAKHENSNGVLTYDSFITALRQLMLPLPDEDYRFIAENYVLANQTGRAIDYRKFLSDLKLHGSAPQKSFQSLTKEQQQIYNQLKSDLKKKGKTNDFSQNFFDKDPSLRGYLARADIEGIFRGHSYTLTRTQFDLIFAPLDNNASGGFNYKQLLELVLGVEEAQKIFGGAALGGGRSMLGQSSASFVMPLQPIGAKTAMMAEIGKKFIQSKRNYEEEIKLRLGEKQALATVPRATEEDFTAVMQACGIILNEDMRLTLQAFIQQLRDPSTGFFPILDLFAAIGLPPQTLGSRGQKQLPQKILSDRERKQCQEYLIRLRQQMTQAKVKPEDIFEKCRETPQALTIPEFRFRLTLTQTPELGQFGKNITEDQVKLLVYYLSQEVPGEVSFKKLYLAMTQVESDVPLAQEGAEGIRKYENMIKDQARRGTPLEIVEFLNFMRQNKLNMSQVFKNTQKGQITVSDFLGALREAGFKARDPQRFVEILDTQGSRKTVSLDKLSEFMQRGPAQDRNITPQVARDKFQAFEPKVKHILQKISEYMKRMGLTINNLYTKMDLNQDGRVDRDEFVTTLSQFIQMAGVDMRDYAMLFNALDLNNDGSLSINEFGMFVEGAKVDKIQRMQELDPQLVQEMAREVQILFKQFDENNDGYVTADEIMRAMMGLGHRITLEEAQGMIRQVDTDGDGRIQQKEFQDLMLKQMKEELLAQEDNVEDLRLKFLDADIDHTGALSVDEIYGVLLKLGAELTLDELIELMHEIDVDRNGCLDIDEFVALMTSTGDEMQFANANSKSTLLSIKRARKLNPVDFFKSFKSMPNSFVPSFIAERWSKRRNLPSSVFMPLIDPKTMLYKDLLPPMQENINPNNISKKTHHPRIRPIPTEVGTEIFFEEAQGVPLPQASEQFDRSQIVKRAVRISLYDTVKKDYIANAIQVNALYSSEQAEDIWQFQGMRDNGLNPVLFRAANKDDVVKPHIFMVFELVIYVRFGGSSAESTRVVEMSCGWCQLDLNADALNRQLTHKLQIKGGSPSAEMLIKDADVHTNRTGIKHSLMRVVNSKITSQLTVQLRPQVKFADETRAHMEFLPQTCFIQKRLLYFVSGFRNYLGEKLLHEGASSSALQTFKKPEGDPIVTTFAKMLDCPDICELLVQIWTDDIWTSMNTAQKMNIEFLILKTKEFAKKVYPVIYSDEFHFRESQSTSSAAGDQYLMRKREELIKSALRYGNPQAKVKVDKPVESMTAFRPFTVKELDYDVWDTTTSVKNDHFLQQYEELGLFGAKQVLPPNQQITVSNLNALGKTSNTLQGGMNFNQAPPIPSFGLSDAFSRAGF